MQRIGSRTRNSGGSTAECAVRPKSAVSGSTTPCWCAAPSMSPSAVDTSTPESDAARGLRADPGAHVIFRGPR